MDSLAEEGFRDSCSGAGSNGTRKRTHEDHPQGPRDEPELKFRVSLARTTLLIDSAPDKDSVTKFATHLLAEVESVAYTERKVSKVPAKPNDATTKLKKMSGGERGDGKGKMDQNRFKDKPEAESGLKDGAQRAYKFFLTEGGCKRGRACTWQHASDGSKRCYNHGSTKRFAQDYPYSGQKAKVLEGQKKGRTEGEGTNKKHLLRRNPGAIE